MNHIPLSRGSLFGWSRFFTDWSGRRSTPGGLACHEALDGERLTARPPESVPSEAEIPKHSLDLQAYIDVELQFFLISLRKLLTEGKNARL